MRSVNVATHLLSSVRDEFLNIHSYLISEMALYDHEPMFKRNSKIITLNDPDIHVDHPEYGDLRYSLFAHANLYRTPLYHFDHILRQEYGKANTIRTIDARFSIIRYYEKEMAISQMALALYVLVNDVPKPKTVYGDSELFLHLLSDSFFTRILSHPDAIVLKNKGRIYELPVRKDNYRFLMSDNRLDDYLSDLITDVIISLNTEAIELIWPLIHLDEQDTLRREISVTLLGWTANKQYTEDIAEFFLRILYYLPDPKELWDIIMDYVIGEYVITPISLEVFKHLLPELSDKDVKHLSDKLIYTSDDKLHMQLYKYIKAEERKRKNS